MKLNKKFEHLMHASCDFIADMDIYNEIRDSLKVLEVIARICADKENWVNAEFGVDGSKLYIDGCTAYENENEKELVKEWIKNERRKEDD